MGGFSGEQNIWFHFNDTPVLVQQQPPDTATPVNVYATEVDANNWKLVLQQFRERDSGVYICRGASSRVSLDIRPGIKPLVIAFTESKINLLWSMF